MATYPLAKVGKKVTFTRRNGEVATGTVCEVPHPEQTNAFVAVNIGDKKKPVIVKCRPSQLSKA